MDRPAFTTPECEPEFTKEEAKDKGQTWYPTYFAPYYTKKNADGSYSTRYTDLGMEVFRHLGVDKDLAAESWRASKLKYAWFYFNPHKSKELENTNITALLNTAIKWASKDSEVTLSVSIDLDGGVISRELSCDYDDSGNKFNCVQKKIHVLDPYNNYQNSSTKNLNTMYKEYETWFGENWSEVLRSGLVISNDVNPYLRPIARYAFFDIERVKITDVKHELAVVDRKTYLDFNSYEESLYGHVNSVKSVLTVTFKLNTYGIDSSPIYTGIIDTAIKGDDNYEVVGETNWGYRVRELKDPNYALTRSELSQVYVPDGEEVTEAEALEFSNLDSGRVAYDSDIWLNYNKKWYLKVKWLRHGHMSDGSVVKASKRIAYLQRVLDFDFKKRSSSGNLVAAIIVIIIVIIINIACKGCFTQGFQTALMAAGIGETVALAVAYTLAISTALNVVAIVASMAGMY
jgi:hypothetical protein